MDAEFRALLKSLRDAIDQAEANDDPQALENLGEVAAVVQRRVDEDETHGLLDALRDAVTRFEATHPELSQAIGRAADTLSASGI